MINNSKNVEKAVEKCFNKYVSSLGKSKINFVNLLSDGTSAYIHHFPYDVLLKISSACNLKCKHCFYYTLQNKFNSRNDFSPEELMQLIEFFIEKLNIIKFTITGGEPFLRKDIFQILKYLKGKNVSIQIQTNATLITEKMAKELDKILDPKVDTIQISLDGVKPETNDEIRGEGSFKKIVKGIKYLSEHNIYTIIAYTLTSVNIDELPDLYKLCKDLKVKRIVLNRFKSCSDEQAYLKPTSDQVFLNVAELIDRIGEDNSVNLQTPNIKTYNFLDYKKGIELLDNYLVANNLPQNNCLNCHNHNKMTVCADGNIYFCTKSEKEELCLGNLREKSFFDIWEKRFHNVFFQGRQLENTICKKCKYVSLCLAGCPAFAYDKYGTIDAPDGDCHYVEKIR